MHHRVAHVLVLACLSFALLSCPAPAAPTAPASAGAVNFVKRQGSDFDHYTNLATPAFADWMRSRFWRTEVFTPYFDDKTSWYPNGLVYQDLYAIYRSSSTASAHPEWILRDGAGNPLYIPWGCSGGTCPQYAGDIGDPAYRSWWIAQAQTALTHGYRGLWIDDVNMDMRVGYGNGNDADPIDKRTGKQMTYDDWRRYVAEFTEQIRAAFPDAEILHNSIWFAGGDTRQNDPYIRREISSADLINLERGVNDDGLTGGDGEWSLNAFLGYIDTVHQLGRNVVIDGVDSDPQPRLYSLASYFLISTGGDGVGAPGVTPENWWGGYDVQLGDAHGSRTTWQGLLRRDFDHGFVLVNPPGSPTRTVDLGGTFYDADGNAVTSVTLAAKSGAVLQGTPPAVAPAPASATAPKTASDPALPTKTVLTGVATAGPAAAASAPATSVDVTGQVERATQGTVRIDVQKRVGKNRFKTVRTTVAKIASKGRFKSRVKSLRSGRYRAVAAYVGSNKAKPSRSKTRAFRVRNVSVSRSPARLRVSA